MWSGTGKVFNSQAKFSFRHPRIHRTGVHTDGTSTRSRAPGALPWRTLPVIFTGKVFRCLRLKMIDEHLTDVCLTDFEEDDAERLILSRMRARASSFIAGAAGAASSTLTLDRSTREELLTNTSCMEAAATLLLTSHFGASQGWETHVEQLTWLSIASLRQAKLLEFDPMFSRHELYVIPDCNADGANPATTIHRFQLQAAMCASLLPSLLCAASQQRRDFAGVEVSNVGGWHSSECFFDCSTDPWHEALPPIIRAALVSLSCVTHHGPCGAHPVVSGWLNSSGAAAFNAVHDHGREVQWSLVLFVATGEAHEGAHEGAWPPLDGSPEQTATSGHTQTVEKTVGGSLLLKFAAGLGEHGQACCFVVPVRPHPGELWAFPGFVPHCVLPRRLGKIAAVAEEAGQPEATRAKCNPDQRVSVAFNVYSATSMQRAD